MTRLAWKPNWPETQQHFTDWWQRRGLVLGAWTPPAGKVPREVVAPVSRDVSPERAYTDVERWARANHADLAGRTAVADTLPISQTNIGPGSLALLLGCEPGFSRETVWFDPCWRDVARPEELPPLRFDPANRWWRVHEALLRASVALARGKYLVGCPDLVENIDILSAMRDPQTFMFDLIERPDWVKAKVAEINAAWFEAFQRVYDIIKLEDGSSTFGAFAIWGPGKTAKVQCDAAAMISPAMFAEFVAPALTAQCAWLDCSMYHLDGTQALCHLDRLLTIEPLDAIEWTPQAGIEQGGHPRWYPLYRRIRAAGKSVQAVGVKPEETVPLLDAVGGKGMYIQVGFRDEAQAEVLMKVVEPYRR